MFKVATKAVIFNHNKTEVLVIYMDNIKDYGLPGGHIEENESINDAIKRELAEECGITSIELKKIDFFTHSNGKIILAFLGQLNNKKKLVSQQNEKEGIPIWLNKDAFEKISIEPNYKKLVLENW